MEDTQLLRQVAEDIRDFRQEVNSKLDSLGHQVSELDKQVSVQAKEIEFIKKEDIRTNNSLEEHIAGVQELRSQNLLLKDQFYHILEEKNSALDARIKKLESPIQWLKQTGWLIVGTGSIAYALYYILHFVQSLPK